jgi:hypothetical protein
MNLYYCTEALKGTWKFPNEAGWYLEDPDDGKLYGPGVFEENAIEMWTKATGKKPPTEKA